MTSSITTIACLFFPWVRIGPPNQLDLDRAIQSHNHIQEPRLFFFLSHALLLKIIKVLTFFFISDVLYMYSFCIRFLYEGLC